MGSKSQTQADRNLNWIKGTTFPASPATLYLAAFTAAPSMTGAGTEVSGGSYARVAITSASGWSAISTVSGAEQISNAADVVFPTASADWGTIVGWGLFDASSAGSRLRQGALNAPVTVLNGDTFKVLAGQAVIREN